MSGAGARRKWAVLAVLAGAQLLVQLDATIINTAMPAIKRHFELSEAQSLWVVDSYLVIFGGLLLLAGALGDRFGRRKVLLIGMFLFTVASIGLAFSPNANVVIAGRALQGLGGALVVPQTLSILTVVFPREERAKAFGVWSASLGAGMAVGPFLGGALVDNIGWAAVFWVPAPIAAAAMLGALVVPESRSQQHASLDVPGAVFGTAAMIAVVFAVIEGVQRGWTDPLILASFGVALATGALFVAAERRSAAPLVPFSFFRQRDFTGSVVGMFFIMFALMGVMFYLPQFFQLVQGESAFMSGVYTMPLALGMMFLSPLWAKLLPKLGPRFMLTWAPAVHGGGALLILSFLTPDVGYWLPLIGLIWLGIGGSMHMPATTDTTMAAVPVDLAGKASAVTNAGRQLGGTLAIAILGSFAAAVYASGVESGLAGSGVPAAAVETLSTGIGAAEQVLPTLGSAGAEAGTAVQAAFVDAITQTMRFGIIFAVVSGLAGFFLIPSRQRMAQMGAAVAAAPAQAAQAVRAAAAAPERAVAAAQAAPAETARLVAAAFAVVLARAQKTAP